MFMSAVCRFNILPSWGFCCAFDMMSGNLKCMTIQGRRTDASKPPHLPRMEAAGRAWSPERLAAKGKAVRCGARLPCLPRATSGPCPSIRPA